MARPSGGNDFDSEKEEFGSGAEGGGFFNMNNSIPTNNFAFNNHPPIDSMNNSIDMDNSANFNRFSKHSLLGPPKHVQPLFGPNDTYLDMEAPNTSNFNRYPKHSLLGPPKRLFGDHINNYPDMEPQNNFNRFPPPRFIGPPKHNQQHQFGPNDNFADMEASNHSNYNRYSMSKPRFMGSQKHGQRQFDRNWTNTEPYATKKNYF